MLTDVNYATCQQIANFVVSFEFLSQAKNAQKIMDRMSFASLQIDQSDKVITRCQK